MLKGYSTAFFTYKSDRRVSYWVQPTLSSNGTWGVSPVSVRSGGGADSNAYVVFSKNTSSSSYCDRVNEGAWIEFYVKDTVEIDTLEIVSNDGYLPSSGKLQYSDDGVTYVDCGTWTDTSGSVRATITVTRNVGKHPIWRICSLGRSSAHPTNNADISLVNIKTTPDYMTLNYSTPIGAGGYVRKAFVTYKRVGPTSINKQVAFVSYKQDNKINLWEGSSASISAKVSHAFVTYVPHKDVGARIEAGMITKRLHEGVKIKDYTAFITYKREELVPSFIIPLGISGYTSVYISYRILSLCSYINDIQALRIAGVALEDTYYPIGKIRAINGVLLQNNNSTD